MKSKIRLKPFVFGVVDDGRALFDVARTAGMPYEALLPILSTVQSDPRKLYVSMSIPKSTWKRRTILVPVKALATIQKSVLSIYLSHQRPMSHVHGFASGRSHVTNAFCHIDARVLVSFDLANFFESITGDQVFGVFKQITHDDKLALQLTLLCTVVQSDGVDPRDLSRRFLVQGTCTSPALSNLVCIELDKRLRGLIKHTFPDWKLSRYVDDITFSSKKRHLDVGQLKNAVTRIVEGCGFKINADKFAVHRDATALPVTGLLVSNTVRVPAKVLNNVRAKLHNSKKADELTALDTDQITATLGYANFVNSDQFRAFVTKHPDCLRITSIQRMYTRASMLTRPDRSNLYKKVKLLIHHIERMGPNRASCIKDQPVLSELRLLLRGYWIYDRSGWNKLVNAHPWVEEVMRRTEKLIEIKGKLYGTHYAWHPYQLTNQRNDRYFRSTWSVVDDRYLQNDVIQWDDWIGECVVHQ